MSSASLVSDQYCYQIVIQPFYGELFRKDFLFITSRLCFEMLSLILQFKSISLIRRGFIKNQFTNSIILLNINILDTLFVYVKKSQHPQSKLGVVCFIQQLIHRRLFNIVFLGYNYLSLDNMIQNVSEVRSVIASNFCSIANVWKIFHKSKVLLHNVEESKIFI